MTCISFWSVLIVVISVLISVLCSVVIGITSGALAGLISFFVTLIVTLLCGFGLRVWKKRRDNKKQGKDRQSRLLPTDQNGQDYYDASSLTENGQLVGGDEKKLGHPPILIPPPPQPGYPSSQNPFPDLHPSLASSFLSPHPQQIYQQPNGYYHPYPNPTLANGCCPAYHPQPPPKAAAPIKRNFFSRLINP